MNKMLLLLPVVLLLSVQLFAQTEQTAGSTITNVTIFRDQAQVTRISKISLQPGTTNLVFGNLSPFINLNSLQVKTDANVNLLSVSQRNNFLKSDEKPRAVIELEDTLASVNQLLELNRIRKEGLLLEKDVIISNKSIGGTNGGVKIEDLEDALTLFRKRSIEIGEDLLKLATQEKKLRTIQEKLASQLAQLNNSNNNIEIVITVKTLAAVSNSHIELSYIVTNASWVPFYDVRVKDTKSPIQLISKANITQATGEDWNNIILKLSTSNPNEGGTKPELQTNFLRYDQPVRGFLGGDQKRMDIQSLNANGAVMEKSMQGNAEVHHTTANIEFNVISAYSIPSDNNPHQVDLTINNLAAHYSYAAVPKEDKDAFVTAMVSGNDLVNQVSGEANIYFDGTFTGKTFINGTTSDSMLISLGRDKRIQIQRTKLKDFSNKTFSGSSKKESTTYEISVRNTRKEPVTILIEDQIPVSTDKEIEIKLLNSSNANYDETTGKLSWIIRLDGEQSQNWKFSFEVKYPKDKTVTDY